MRVGWLKMEIFASFTRYIFQNFTSKATFIMLYYVAHLWLFNDTQIGMTLNGHFALKSVSGLVTNGLASPAFRQNCSNICKYPYTASDKNVAQGT